MKDPADIKDAEVRKLAEQADRTKKSNSLRIGALEQMGVQIDASQGRIEHLMDQLVSFGVISEEEQYRAFVSWEVALADQITGIEKEIRRRIAEAQARTAQRRLATPQGAGGLVGPDGQPIRVSLPPPDEGDKP